MPYRAIDQGGVHVTINILSAMRPPLCQEPTVAKDHSLRDPEAVTKDQSSKGSSSSDEASQSSQGSSIRNRPVLSASNSDVITMKVSLHFMVLQCH